MNILAGGPARETESDLFLLHREGLEAQTLPLPMGVTPLDLPLGKVAMLGDSPITIRHEIVPDPGGPRWNPEKIERVAKARQAFMEQGLECPCSSSKWVTPTRGQRAREWAEGYVCRACESPRFDALFMVDTDVICGPGVLERMLAVDADVVFGCFWTRCSWGGPYGDWPQVWDVNPYGFRAETGKLLLEDGVNEVEVFGGGACTLIRGRGFESRYWPLLDSLSGAPGMWAGEDRSYCLGLEARGIRMVAVTGLPIVHLHTDHSPEALDKARTEVGLSRSERV